MSEVKTQIYIDSADTDEIETANRWGVISGITTNPTLLRNASKNRIYITSSKPTTYLEIIEDFIKNIPSNLDVHIELTSKNLTDSLCESDKLFMIKNRTSKKINIKVPISDIETINKLINQESHNIKKIWKNRINATLVFNESQALMAHYSGASYISVFIGRLDDDKQNGTSKSDGITTLSNIIKIFKINNISTKVISASIRNETHVIESIKAGADIVTVPFKILKQMTTHHITTHGIRKFNEDLDTLLKEE